MEIRKSVAQVFTGRLSLFSLKTEIQTYLERLGSSSFHCLLVTYDRSVHLSLKLCVCLVPFPIYSELFVKNCEFFPSPRVFGDPWGWPHSKICGIRKLGVVCVMMFNRFDRTNGLWRTAIAYTALKKRRAVKKKTKMWELCPCSFLVSPGVHSDFVKHLFGNSRLHCCTGDVNQRVLSSCIWGTRLDCRN